MSLRYRLDNGHGNVLGICGEPDCGFRTLANDRAEALRQRAHHQALRHRTRTVTTRRASKPADWRISGALKT